MPVPTVITDLSTTIASNSPAGSESAAATDDYLRAHAGFIAQLYAGTTAGQVVFPATQNPSSDVHTLDDYEEGTFTPNDASGAALPMSAASGAYVKVGKIVAFVANVTYTSTANGSAAKIGGLPFTAAAYNFPVALTTATTNLVSAAVISGTATIGLYTGAGGGTTNAQLSTLSVQLSGWYLATA